MASQGSSDAPNLKGDHDLSSQEPDPALSRRRQYVTEGDEAVDENAEQHDASEPSPSGDCHPAQQSVSRRSHPRSGPPGSRFARDTGDTLRRYTVSRTAASHYTEFPDRGSQDAGYRYDRDPSDSGSHKGKERAPDTDAGEVSTAHEGFTALEGGQSIRYSPFDRRKWGRTSTKRKAVNYADEEALPGEDKDLVHRWKQPRPWRFVSSTEEDAYNIRHFIPL